MNKNYIIIYIHTLKKEGFQDMKTIRLGHQFFSKNVTSRALKVAIIVDNISFYKSW